MKPNSLLLPTVLAAFLAAAPASAQDKADAPPPEKGWKHSLVSGLNLTQVSYTNWAQGGENSLAYTLSLDGKSALTQETILWENQYRFAFGQARLGDKGLRKTDDIIDLSSVLTYLIAEKVNPYASATLRSQFATGYKYDSDNNRTDVSKFFDPAYLTQSVGVRYQPIAEVRTRLGVGLREVITDRYTQYADDPKTPEIEKNGVDGGLEWVTDIEWKAMENVLFTSQLAVFDPFGEMDQPVVNNKNKLTGKINSYLNAMVEFEMIYDHIVSPKAQFREGMSIGLSYTLF